MDFITSASRQVKWIVSSCNRHDVEEGLRLDDRRTRLSPELNTRHISDVVDAYIDYKVSQLVFISTIDRYKLKSRIE